jgi:hypothetical protein
MIAAPEASRKIMPVRPPGAVASRAPRGRFDPILYAGVEHLEDGGDDQPDDHDEPDAPPCRHPGTLDTLPCRVI